MEFNIASEIGTVKGISDIEKFLEKIKDLYNPEKLKEIGTFPYLIPYSVPEELLVEYI